MKYIVTFRLHGAEVVRSRHRKLDAALAALRKYQKFHERQPAARYAIYTRGC